jgi:hypothetical protein
MRSKLQALGIIAKNVFNKRQRLAASATPGSGLFATHEPAVGGHGDKETNLVALIDGKSILRLEHETYFPPVQTSGAHGIILSTYKSQMKPGSYETRVDALGNGSFEVRSFETLAKKNASGKDWKFDHYRTQRFAGKTELEPINRLW